MRILVIEDSERMAGSPSRDSAKTPPTASSGTCRRRRAARCEIRDRIEGLDAGADHYVTKPFVFEELLARRPGHHATPRRRAAPVFRYDDLELDPARGQAMRGGKPLNLSAREFALLQAFMTNADRLMSRTRLYEAVWDGDYDGTSNDHNGLS